MPDYSTTAQEHRVEALIVGLRPIWTEQVVEIESGAYGERIRRFSLAEGYSSPRARRMNLIRVLSRRRFHHVIHMRPKAKVALTTNPATPR